MVPLNKTIMRRTISSRIRLNVNKSLNLINVRSISSFTRIENHFKLPILTPQMQNVRFEKMKLSNGIKTLLISDPHTPITGASMSIEAGSWMDGVHAGTAHFLEHMLFLGTKKYPNESDYERYIFDSNGMLNGYTANDHSMYFFSNLNPGAFEGAIDRFSRFFYEPTFNESCVSRERIAVDEEYEKNIQSDAWRLLHVKKAQTNQDHPFALFNTGNLDTMKAIDRDYLIQWYNTHYSANVMNLVVYGSESIEKLAEITQDAFHHVVDRNIVLPDFTNRPMFPKSLHGKTTWVEPLKNLKQLHLSWEIPSSFIDMKTHPTLLAAHIIGHEGPGSILSSLKRDGLVESLSAGENPWGFQNHTFDVSVSLTDEGMSRWKEVRDRIFAAISKYAESSIEEYIVNETNHMSRIGYQYQQRNPSIAMNYCTMMRKEDLETLPYQSYFISEFDPAKLRNLMQFLTPGRAMSTVVGQSAPEPLTEQEKWMGAKYAVLKEDASILTLTTEPLKDVKIPDPNPFVPDNLILADVPDKEIKPEKILEAQDGMLYFYPDTDFRVPESSLIFNFKTPSIRPGDAKKQCLLSLFLRFANEALNELSYEASSAGLSYSLSPNQGNALMISVDGYSQKIQVLLDQVLNKISHLEIKPAEFEIYKQSLKRSYENSSKNPPLRQASERFQHLVLQHHCTSAKLATAINDITIEDVRQFASTLFSRRIIQGFAGGNVTRQEAEHAFRHVIGALPGTACSSQDVEPSPIFDFTSQTKCLAHQFDVQVSGNACLMGIYTGRKSDETRIGTEVLAKLLKEPFYSELRTKQQTGYIVDSGFNQIRKHMFLMTHIQSNTYTPSDLLARNELFFETFLRDLRESKEVRDRFDSIIESTIQRLLQPHDKLLSKLRYYNYMTYEEDEDYDAIPRRIELLQQYNLDQVEKFAQEVLSRTNYSRLAVLATGSAPENKDMLYAPVTVNDMKGMKFASS